MLAGETRRTVPFLIDMKIFYALLKMSFGASYAPQFSFISIPFFNCLICVLCIPSAANLGAVSMVKEQCRIMAHIRVLYGMGCPTVRGCIVRYPYVSSPYYGALFVGDGVSLPIPPQFGCDECILTHITLYLNQKRGKSRAKSVGSSWYLTPLLWDTPQLDVESRVTLATVGFCCQGSLLDLRPLPRVT